MKPKPSLAELKAHKNMSTKHTPGPWKVNESEGLFFITAKTGNVADIYRPDRYMEGDAEANAALIASAPDLLLERDRLREALKQIQKMSLLHGEMSAAHALVKCNDIARAALNREETP